MNAFRRTSLLVGLILLVAVAASGCRSSEPPPPPPHTENNPGPWKDVTVSISFAVKDQEVKLTITVTDHPEGQGYVRKFELFDQTGTVVGYRGFVGGDVPTQTFLLDPETKRLTVEVTSTELGKWRSNPREVPSRE